MASTLIRPATKADAKIIFDFICELEEADFLFADFEPLYTSNITHPDFIYLVATDVHGLVTGYISCHGQILLHHCAKVFEIQELFVKDTYRGNGVGRQLIKSLEEILKHKNCGSFEVTANIKRVETHEFYKRAGFNHTHFKFTKSIL
jgi:(aminoalkyl)phosphonate N-acetyltransferase